MVNAASGPYEAEPSASNPRIGIPRIGPTFWARLSDVLSGRPKMIREKDDLGESFVVRCATLFPLAALANPKPVFGCCGVGRLDIGFLSYSEPKGELAL